MKYADYLGQTVNARYTIERNIDGADVPVQREGEITIGTDAVGDILLDIDGDFIYPFDQTFELL
jgi:hypothetical protein